MDFNIEIRKKQLESLDQFVTSSRDKLQSLLDCLGWTVDKIEEERLMVPCPYNACHSVSAEKIEEHIKKCEIKNSGYALEESFLSEAGNVLPKRSIKLDTIKKIEVLSHALTQTPFFQTAWNGQDPDPQTFSRLVTTFSRDERLVLYNYCVSNTEGPKALPEFDTTIVSKDEGDVAYTKKALMSFERDIKRRSVKYKPIHTSHKNYKEVLGEVISSQMQQYQDWLSSLNTESCKGPHTPENMDEKGDLENQSKYDYIERPLSSVSRVSNYSSSSQGTVKRHDRSSKTYHHHSRNHSREHDRKHHKGDDSSYNKKYKSSNKHKYNIFEDDSQESSNLSKISTPVMYESVDSSNEQYENISKSHSRDSSLHNYHKYKGKSGKYTDFKSYKSRSPSDERQIRKVHRKCRSRSRHRSEERKSRKEFKTSRERSKRREKNHYNS